MKLTYATGTRAGIVYIPATSERAGTAPMTVLEPAL